MTSPVNTTNDSIKQDLLPCPFCGGQPSIREARMSPTVNRPRGSLISVTISHHCPKEDGQPSGMNVSKIGRDHKSAVKSWNTRQSLPKGGE